MKKANQNSPKKGAKKPDVALTVQCISCKRTRVLLASEGPHNDIPLCEHDGMPMLPKKAVAK